MITKSEVKALDNSVKVKVKGEWVYMPIDDIEIGGVKLKAFISNALSQVIERVEPMEARLVERMDQLQQGVNDNKSAIEKALKGLITR